jgi:hypothetical protein
MEQKRFLKAESAPIEQNKEFIKEKRPNELKEQLELASNFLEAYGAFKKDNELSEEFGIKRNEVEWLKNLDQLSLEYLRDSLVDLVTDMQAIENTKNEDKKIMDLIERYSQERAPVLRTYEEVLKGIFNVKREKIHKLFSEAIGDKSINPELRLELDKKTINSESELSLEQAEILKKAFPSGNFLLHTAGVKESLMIIKSGLILSSLEIVKNMREHWGRGGGAGISFNMNDVRVLNGDAKHFIGFLADPEIILNENYKLVVPRVAAEYEARLVPKSYDAKDKNSSELSEPRPEDWGAYPENEMPRVEIEQTFIFCNELDANILKNALAANGKNPKGIITYPNKEIRVRSWRRPVGDHEVAARFIQKVFGEAKIKPSIDWAKDLFPKYPRIDYGAYVSNSDIKNSRWIVKKNGKLYIEGREGFLKKKDYSKIVERDQGGKSPTNLPA